MNDNTRLNYEQGTGLNSTGQKLMPEWNFLRGALHSQSETKLLKW